MRKVLEGSLDKDTFDIAQQPINDAEFLSSCTQVIQDGKLGGKSSHNQLVSRPESIAAAVVDRSANLDEAARDLINARFAFRGKSPYAPDIVFVNEFVKKDFLQALVRQSIAAGESVRENGTMDKQKSRGTGLRDFIADLQRNGDVRVITQDSSRAIVDIKQRSVSCYDFFMYNLTSMTEVPTYSRKSKSHVCLYIQSEVLMMRST